MPVSIKVDAKAWIFLAFLILTVPFGWITAGLLAAIVHEMCHILVIIALKVPIYSVSVGIFGAKIHTAPLSDTQEFVCAAAGPLGSFLCGLLIHRWPMIALCGLVQGFFNLLPIYPLDGGRMLRCLFRGFGKIPCKESNLGVQ